MTPYSFSFSKAGDSEVQLLTAGQQFRFDLERYESVFLQPVPSRLIDLLRIASAIYVADRLSKRKRRDQVRAWSRSLAIKIGVLDPTFWNGEHIQEALAETIEFLTDDTWTFAFEKDDRRSAKRELQKNLFSVIPADARVCLYSGGLDSAAGLGVQIAEEPAREVLPVTIWHQPIQRKLIHEQFDVLRSRLHASISPLIVKTALIWTSELKRHREERSQRSRAFLFLAAGAAAAAMAGGTQVEIYESGIGALNFPLMAGMVGSRTTRSVHPEFLKRMSNLVSLVYDRAIVFELPFLAFTKGKVVRRLSDQGLSDLARMTFSCIHFPLREAGHKQCGTCPACIFRRQALLVAGISEGGAYKHNLFGPQASSDPVSAVHLRYLKAFLGQVVQLDGIRLDADLPPRFRRHLNGTGILASNQSSAEIARLLCAYRDEWKTVIRQAETHGVSWTKLVARSAPALEGAACATA